MIPFFGGVSLRRRPKRPLGTGLESLEPRLAMSSTPAALLYAPEWFRDVDQTPATLESSPATWSALSVGGEGAVTSALSGDGNSSDWIVRFRESALGGVSSVADTASLLVGEGVAFHVLRGLGLVGQVLVRATGVSPDMVRSVLAANPYVAGFEQDAVHQFNVMPADPHVGQLWGLENIGQTGGAADADIDAAAAWTISTGSRNVVVAVIDTGVDWRHVDLAANLWTNAGEVAGNGIDDDGNGLTDDFYGYNFAASSGDPMDDNGHGTHVAGTIAAVGNNGVGVTGINWSSSIMALKFLRADGSGTISDAIRAINYATVQRVRFGVNVRVINMSWGGGGFSNALSEAIQSASSAGILCVAAAGNSARNNDVLPQYPSSYDVAGLVAVAATDSRDNLARFSNYGGTSVDLAAPGVAIVSTYPNNRYVALSGTSMAAPHVSGVAALAWSVAPNATVAEVKNALLGGVDRVSGLAGKVLSGGRLNAYNTLRLLDARPPAAPVVESVEISPGTLVAGTRAALTARGVQAGNSPVSSVWFYLDANSNGQWDSADSVLGSTATIVGQQATLTLDTTGFSPGTHRVFARALDESGSWSDAASATFQVLAADDHGNDAASATALSSGSCTLGAIEQGGDRDWFQFTATAGRRYEFFTQLITLQDSVLTLYGPDGTTALVVNDDAPGRGLASEIHWTAPASGTYFLEVRAYSSGQVGSYSLVVRGGDNTAPSLLPIANQVMSGQQDAISVTLNATDREGDALTFSADVVPGDSLAGRAYELDQSLKLSSTSNYLQNRLGLREKWMRGAGRSWYFILPNGELRKWTGRAATSPVVATLSRDYWANPRLLYRAKPAPQIIPADAISLTLQGSVLTINPADGLVGQFEVRVTVSDGMLTDTKSFTVAVQPARSSALAEADSLEARRFVFSVAIDELVARRPTIDAPRACSSFAPVELSHDDYRLAEKFWIAASAFQSISAVNSGSAFRPQAVAHDVGLAQFFDDFSTDSLSTDSGNLRFSEDRHFDGLMYLRGLFLAEL